MHGWDPQGCGERGMIGPPGDGGPPLLAWDPDPFTDIGASC